PRAHQPMSTRVTSPRSRSALCHELDRAAAVVPTTAAPCAPCGEKGEFHATVLDLVVGALNGLGLASGTLSRRVGAGCKEGSSAASEDPLPEDALHGLSGLRNQKGQAGQDGGRLAPARERPEPIQEVVQLRRAGVVPRKRQEGGPRQAGYG